VTCWETAKLGDLVTFKTGKIDSNAATPDGEYPFFTCSQETLRTDTYAFDTECVLLAGNNANGIYPIKYYSGKFNAYQRTYVIRSQNDQRLINRFLFFALQPKLDLLRRMSTGAATKFLTLTILKEFDFELPPLPVQRAIAGVLAAYDELIENNTRRIKLLEQMAQALYREWFVRPCQAGKLPKGWEEKQVGDVIETLGGGTPSTKTPEFWEGGDVIWFTPSDLTAAGTIFIADSGKMITRTGLDGSSAKLFPAYSVMMTSRATIGVVAINTKEACTNQGFITCIPNDRVSAYHLFFWIEENEDKIISIASGATYKEISRSEFRELPIAVPPVEVAKRFAQMVQPVGKLIENLQAKNANLRRTRDLLLPKLISGEVVLQ